MVTFMNTQYDLIIIGSGPAGLAASIYASRATLKTLIIEKEYISGGQVNNTYEVDNYPGLPMINGLELGNVFREHANKLGGEFVTEAVKDIEDNDTYKTVITSKNTYTTKAIILATGAHHRLLDVPGEATLSGMGVSYCATCDGAFFKNKIVAVVGGGDVALEDAIFLARTCSKVYVIHRRDEFRGARSLANKLFKLDNVEILWNSAVTSINGESKVDSINVKNVKNNNEQTISLDGVFIAVGITPNSSIFAKLVECDSNGYIIADETCKTSVKGIFAAGDLRTKQLRQIITAASDGACAVHSAESYINSLL